VSRIVRRGVAQAASADTPVRPRAEAFTAISQSADNSRSARRRVRPKRAIGLGDGRSAGTNPEASDKTAPTCGRLPIASLHRCAAHDSWFSNLDHVPNFPVRDAEACAARRFLTRVIEKTLAGKIGKPA